MNNSRRPHPRGVAGRPGMVIAATMVMTLGPVLPGGAGRADLLAFLGAVAGIIRSPLLGWPEAVVASVIVLAAGLALIATGVRGLRRGRRAAP